MTERRATRLAVIARIASLSCIVLAGCTQPVPRIEEPTAAPLPAAEYERAAREGAAVYRVDPARSLILVHVGRAGRMQSLGHDHAVASTDVQGFVAMYPDPARSRADIAFPLRNLVVDDPAHRQRLGLDAGPDEDDIAGTYTNMLKVLEPDVAPWATLAARVVEFRRATAELRVTISLHGVEHELGLPVRLVEDGRRLTVTGSAVLTHDAFGLAPYSTAGGLLRVADDLEISFEIVAARRQSN